MEVEELVSISRIYPTGVRLRESLVLIDNCLCDQVSDLREGEVPTFLGRVALDWGLKVVHRGALVIKSDLGNRSQITQIRVVVLEAHQRA